MPELRLPKINSLHLSGRLTREPELKYTSANNTAVCKLSLAFDRSFQKDGEWQQETSYLDITVWGKQAEYCSEKLIKGSPVLVEGYLRTYTYIDKENNNRKATEIVAQKIHSLAKNEQESAPVNEQPAQQNVDDSSDVPF